MVDTVNYGQLLPTPGASPDTWGVENNALHNFWDAQIKANQDAIEAIPVVDLTPYATLASPTFTGTVTGTFSGNLTGDVTGNVSGTSSAWATARTLSLGGILGGSIAIDGSADGTLTATMADGVLSIAKTAGLQGALDAKEPTLNADQKLKITYGTAAPGALAVGEVYLQQEA